MGNAHMCSLGPVGVGAIHLLSGRHKSSSRALKSLHPEDERDNENLPWQNTRRGIARRTEFLVYGVNSVSCDPCGIVQDLQSVYPYEKTYTGRKRLYSLLRGEINSRDEPGSIIVHEPPAEENSPHLLVCVTQYGWSESTESNAKAQQAVTTSSDHHYVEGLGGDTRASRRAGFQTCMKKVAILAMGHREVEKVIIPEGIGRRGRSGEEWQEHYLPWIQSLASRLQPFGIETIRVRLSE